MPVIQILDENTANQIAAGEVIERPASAVKELVENAVDAGASRIVVELEGAGKILIRVTDDGVGMSQEDAIISLQRHATSKITSAADLFSIRTLGFRGEAMPSIASVSQLTLVTRERDGDERSGATLIRVDGGTIAEVTEVGAAIGTSITVENLLYNVPARLKFLKTNATELNQITERMQRFALSHPNIAFRLINEGHEIFSSQGGGTLFDACVRVYGRDQARHLIPIAWGQGDDLRVHGFVGTPQALRGTRAGQHTFVNGRFVRDRAVTRAIDEGYSSVQTLHGTRHPLVALMIEIDPSLVDVNVSPTKTEVRFTRDREIFSAVYHAIADALVERGGLVPNISDKFAATTDVASESRAATAPMFDVPAIPRVNTRSDYDAGGWVPPAGAAEGWHPRIIMQPPDHGQPVLHPQPADRAAYVGDPFDDAPLAAPTYELTAVDAPPHPVDDDNSVSVIRGQDTTNEDNSAPADTMPHGTADIHRGGLASIRILAQTRNMYILAQTERSLVLIDQHIAHERVLYERFMRGAGAKALAVQGLLVPLTLQLGRREALVLADRLDALAKAGFEIEPFGQETFLVRSAPAAVEKRNRTEAVIREIVDELVEKTISRKLMAPSEEVLITASCKMAVKAGDPMSFPEMEALIADLITCENPYTCPHGRPILIELPNNDLDRKFGRM